MTLTDAGFADVAVPDRDHTKTTGGVDQDCAASLFGRVVSSAFRLSASPMFDIFRGPSLLFGISAVAFP
jgi:hypothetical protein